MDGMMAQLKTLCAGGLAALALVLAPAAAWSAALDGIEQTAALQDRVTVGDAQLDYTVTAGKLLIRTDEGNPSAAMSAAIVRYLRMNRRWQSPKFLLGSSYGTTRASIVTDKLQSDGMAINGVILVGSALNFGMQDNGLDQQFTLGLPSMAAIAWHHGKTAYQSMALPDFLREVEAFVRTEYGPALYRGNRLPPGQKQALAKKLAGYIGLDAQYIHDAHLRVSVVRFRKELLRDQGLTVGRLDGRSVSADFDSVGEEPENDYWLMEELLMPARGVIESFYGAELGRDDPQDYRIVAAGAIQAWTWDHELPNIAGISRYELQERNIFPQNTWVAAHLSAAMRANRNLRVFQAHGYFDLATPYVFR